VSSVSRLWTCCDGLVFCIFVLFCYFFFFQAEDGIRDGHVTGVQTCALPIWSEFGGASFSALIQLGKRSFAGRNIRSDDALVSSRSEERRVGKECRSGWGAGH